MLINSVKYGGVNTSPVGEKTGGLANSSSRNLGFGGFYNSKTTRGIVKGVTKMVNESGAIFENAFGLALATLIRPVCILLTPGAEKRDKQYAAAHSIASGFTGFASAWLMFKPIAMANDRLLENIEKVVKNKNVIEGLTDIVKKNAGSEEIKEGVGQLAKRFEDASNGAEKLMFKKLRAVKKLLGKSSGSENQIKILNGVTGKLQGMMEKDMAKIPEKMRYLTDSKSLEIYKRITTHGFRILAVPLIAFVTIGLISPVMKKLFPPQNKNKMFDVNYVAAQNLMRDKLSDDNTFLAFTLRNRSMRRQNAES